MHYTRASPRYDREIPVVVVVVVAVAATAMTVFRYSTRGQATTNRDRYFSTCSSATTTTRRWPMTETDVAAWWTSDRRRHPRLLPSSVASFVDVVEGNMNPPVRANHVGRVVSSPFYYY